MDLALSIGYEEHEHLLNPWPISSPQREPTRLLTWTSVNEVSTLSGQN